MTDLLLTSGRLVPLTAVQLDRFRSLIAPAQSNGCQLWRGPVDHGGYGRFRIRSSADRRWANLAAHRLAFRLAAGRQPDPALDVDHECHDELCLVHLRERRPLENALDHRIAGIKRARAARPRVAARADLEDVCAAGHPRELWTRFYGANRERVCLLCNREKVARHAARQRLLA